MLTELTSTQIFMENTIKKFNNKNNIKNWRFQLFKQKKFMEAFLKLCEFFSHFLSGVILIACAKLSRSFIRTKPRPPTSC